MRHLHAFHAKMTGDVMCCHQAMQQDDADIDESAKDADDMENALHQLGLSNRFIDRSKDLSNVHVSEVYSPPRVTAIANRFNLTPGFALDLTKNDPDDGLPWHFSRSEKRDKAITETQRRCLSETSKCRWSRIACRRFD